MQPISTTDYKLAGRQLWEYFQPFIQYLSSEDQEVVELAFMQMVEAHKEQRRKSGEFYTIHPVSACVFLTKIGLDRDTLAACLMHDVPEDTNVSLAQLQKTFNKEIIFLVSGITKLSKIKYQGEERYAENLRKMFVAMSQDLRVVFIKLADRLHNLQTLSSLPPHKAKRIALESLEIYVPIAHKLGINYFKGLIEDEAFKYAYPQLFKSFVSQSKIEINRRHKVVQKMKVLVANILDQEGIKGYELKGRAKKYYSIYRKMKDKGKTLESIRDLVAIRIITSTEEECYQVFSLLNKNFKVVDGATKDYITLPKPNGYRSLHITVEEPGTGDVMEFQVRTKEMHNYAEFGAASHWAYKSRGNQEQGLNPESFKWISELIDLSKEELSHEEYIKHVKLDLYQDRIFVLTPNNDVINLPIHSSPLDFAYRIHSHVGNTAVLARVNEQPMKLSGELQNGDLVEIVTDKHQKPKLDWLKFVKTRSAAQQIRYRLRQQGILK